LLTRVVDLTTLGHQPLRRVGVNFFDTTNVYSNDMSEDVTEGALRDFARR
jgi:hypothetical protein